MNDEMSSKIKLKVLFKDDKVLRQFDSSNIVSNPYGQAFNKIVIDGSITPNSLAQTFEKIHRGIDVSKLTEVFEKHIYKNPYGIFEYQQVAWYFSEFFRALKTAYKSGRFSTYSIRVKACRDYYYYAIEGRPNNGNSHQLLYFPFFQKATPPSDPTIEKEKVQGLTDSILFLAPELMRCGDDQTDAVRLISWFIVDLDFTVIDKESNDDLFTLSINPKVSISECIEMPPKYKSVLVASPNVRSAIANLSEIWLNPTCKSVLLCAWTGSGKEVLYQFLASAMDVYDRQKLEIVMSAPELGTFENLSHRVLKRLGPHHDNNKLVIVFLDEIHHRAAGAIRSGLLRLMETNQLPATDHDPDHDLDCKSFLYVLATSLPPEKIRSIDPPDLWTRVEHTVKLRHPFLIKDNADREETLKAYFTLFWKMQRDQWKAESIIMMPQIRLIDEESDVYKNFLKAIMKKFVTALGSPLIPLISIRLFRTMVKRLFMKTIEYIRVHQNEDEILKKIEEVFDDWVIDIFEEIVPEIDTRGVF